MRLASFLALSLLPMGFVGTAHAEEVTRAGKITTPKEHLGFNLGDDYCLANYQQLMSYWAKLEKESDRLKVVSLGTTEEGRPQLMGVVTSPANHAKLDRHKAVAAKLAGAEGVDEAAARRLAAEGKAVVWIDGGLHASEVLCAQVLMETLYQFVAGNDDETLRILNDVIILFVHANPDGMDLVADHYMQNKEPAKRSLSGLPRLYQKYIGHDNNRDSYAHTQAETRNMNRAMYREWFPQIAYDHHQTGPAGTVVFIPPCRDPSNYNLDPLVLNGIDGLSNAMIQRLLSEGKPGATVRSGARFSTWWNGGLTTTCQFHNMIGIFTETWGSPTPSQIPYLPRKLLPNGDYLAPIPPQEWHFRQSLGYSVSGNKAVLDYAARNREHLLFNIWRMGNNSIERGSRDHWTVTPKMVEPAAKAMTPAAQARRFVGRGGAGGAGGGGGTNLKDYEKYFRDPAQRDPRGYILPANQPDFLTATKFINALLGTGVKVQRATADFAVGGKTYPRGSYVVPCAQAFRPHVIDMFEPQDHPNDVAYPGAAPTPPYDSAGYTPAFQMGVQFDRILDGFGGPFETLTDEVPPPPAAVAVNARTVGFFLDTRANDSFRAVNRLLRAGEEVRRLQEPFTAGGTVYPAGTFFIPRKPSAQQVVETIAFDLGTPFTGTPSAPTTEAVSIKPVRIALWDRKGGSMSSGWTRWLLERFDFPFKVVLNDDLKGDTLRENFDVLLLVEEAFAADGGKELVAALKAFVEDGGTIVATGSSTRLGKALGLPLANHLTATTDKGETEALDRDKYYVPSSVLRVRLNNTHPLTWGMAEHADVMFSNAPTFRFPPEAEAKQNNLTRLAWFDTKTPLRSGWAWGQDHLEGGTAMVDAKLGKGRLALFGPHVLYRGQSHGTFKLVFNAIVQAGAKTADATGP
ncbi:MAG: M14 metallopeptidase family protein [Gemmataceae bacterium]